MAARKFLALLLCALLFVPAAMIALSPDRTVSSFPDWTSFRNGSAAERIEQAVTEVFPGAHRLSDLTASIQTALGRNQQNGCFYSEDGILVNLEEADSAITQINLASLAFFAESTSTPCYFLLTPTAAAIEQGRIPDFALPSLFNQKQYIQNCYGALSSRFRTIDGYGALFPHQEEYLYYRTESALTAAGCYYLYSGAGEKLGYTARTMDDFSVSHYDPDFLGSLAQLVPYSHVKADIVSCYQYKSPQHTVSLSPDPLRQPSRASLYDPQLTAFDQPLSIYLGSSAITDLSLTGVSNDKRLLVYTDGSCDAMFPLLATHYPYIRVVNLLQADPHQLARIRPNGFDQVLFCFSVGTFGYDRTIGDQLS